MSGDTDAATESRRAKGCNKLLGKTVRLQSGDWLGRRARVKLRVRLGLGLGSL